jgi:hypothetical protein
VSIIGSNNTITVGNGIGVNVQVAVTAGFTDDGNSITVGNGGDTITVGFNNTVTLGKGADNVVIPNTVSFDVTNIETINHFNTTKDLITVPNALATNFNQLTLQDVNGNTVITFPNDSFDKVVLVGVHSSALHESDFHFG